MQQRYLDAKAAAPGCIVLFRMGDFYESFHDDVRIVAKCLRLVLSGNDVPMCGFPCLVRLTALVRSRIMAIWKTH